MRARREYSTLLCEADLIKKPVEVTNPLSRVRAAISRVRRPGPLCGQLTLADEESRDSRNMERGSRQPHADFEIVTRGSPWGTSWGRTSGYSRRRRCGRAARCVQSDNSTELLSLSAHVNGKSRGQIRSSHPSRKCISFPSAREDYYNTNGGEACESTGRYERLGLGLGSYRAAC